MAERCTTADLLTSVKLQTFVPKVQPDVSDSDILLLATECLESLVISPIKGTRASYFLAKQDVSITENDQEIDIPARSIGSTIAKLIAVDSNGRRYELPILAEGQGATLAPTSMQISSRPVAYIRGSKIILNNVVSGLWNTVQIIYAQRPGDLVLTSACLQVASLTSTSLTFSANLSTISIATGTKFDVVSQKSPYPYVLTSTAGTVSGMTVSDLTSTTGIAVGDWITLEGTSPIPQVPYEYHMLLRKKTAIAVLEALGDRAGVQVAEAKAMEMEKKLALAISPRLDEQPEVFVSGHPYRSGNLW